MRLIQKLKRAWRRWRENRWVACPNECGFEARYRYFMYDLGYLIDDPAKPGQKHLWKQHMCPVCTLRRIDSQRDGWGIVAMSAIAPFSYAQGLHEIDERAMSPEGLKLVTEQLQRLTG